jgi:hypothetical protein
MASLHAYNKFGKRIPSGLGICGGHADLCADCYRAEVSEQEAIMRPTMNAFPRHPSESLGDYWRRIGGRFLDCWYLLASRAPVSES